MQQISDAMHLKAYGKGKWNNEKRKKVGEKERKREGVSMQVCGCAGVRVCSPYKQLTGFDAGVFFECGGEVGYG
jgi:hypothetical protein